MAPVVEIGGALDCDLRCARATAVRLIHRTAIVDG